MSVVWNERNAAHLLRRAGFGATRHEVATAVARGMVDTVERLLDESATEADLDSRLASIDTSKAVGIVRWWLVRMIYSRRPLVEKMTFFLHDHFATSFEKVSDSSAMLAQNELLRRFALGNFTDLTIEISRDPAMLRWLDNYLNRKEQPNENYARELLELFTLGHGHHYGEEDVAAAARAFTGWSIDRRTGEFVFVPRWHDDGSKTFLGETGNWNGDDIVRIATRHPAHAPFIARKILQYFVAPNPDDALVERMAAVYADSGNELKPLMRAIFTADEFYAEPALWSKVKSPVEHAVIAARSLGIVQDPSRFIVGFLGLQGQIPFAPPDVDGWPADLEWINSTSLITRMTLSGALTVSSDPGRLAPGSDGSPSTIVDSYLEALGPLDVEDDVRDALLDYYAPGGAPPSGQLSTIRQRGLIQVILSLSEWQLN